MPPPPESIQQRIDAARIDAARASTNPTAVPPAPSPPPREIKSANVKPTPVTEEPPVEVPPTIPEEDAKETATTKQELKTDKNTKVDESVKQQAVAEEEALPSKHQAKRWQLSNKLQRRMDDFLAKAALVSHKVNNYTGTDYSGIERLRREIYEQEQLVKAAHAEVLAAKLAYTTSYSQQAASQKEVVGLLERKHSWLAADLERYMSLIRSEHLNEQAVQAAKEHLENTERHLEDARAKLEKRERKQYHEEQIWSDTIRRNSTWVTFGLMGLNIFLLLANLVVFEPWRRRRIVREIKTALDEKTTMAPALSTAVEAESDKIVEPEISVLEKVQDKIVEPDIPVLEKVQDKIVDAVELVAAEVMPEPVPDVVLDMQPDAMANSEVVVGGDTALVDGEVLGEEAVEIDQVLAETKDSAEEVTQEPVSLPPPEDWQERFDLWKEILSANLLIFKARLQDLFSDRQVTVRRIDVTTIALESAAASVAVVGLVWALLSTQP
jgi:sensitive to high expression protein 9